jgi:hypothetical protein
MATSVEINFNNPTIKTSEETVRTITPILTTEEIIKIISTINESLFIL